MIVDAGKSPAVVRMKDGSILTFFNNGIYDKTQTITYKDEANSTRYLLKVDKNDFNSHNRALHYVRSYPGSAINNIEQERLVIFTNQSENRSSPAESTSTVQGNLIATPLFEVINPQIFSDGNNFQMTFWTNLKDASGIK